MLLTDGVIAIAITLMVLELEIPDLKENPNGLLEMTGDLFLIAVGFLSLGLYWTFHHYLFHYIKRADGVLMLLNIMFLALASLVPFWVAFININVGENEAMIYYGVGMILTLLVLMYIWFYATRNHRLVSKDLEKNIITGWLKVLMVALIVSVIVIAGNVLIPWFKFISWIFSLVFFIYLTAHGYKNFLVPENLEPKNKTKAII